MSATEKIYKGPRPVIDAPEIKVEELVIVIKLQSGPLRYAEAIQKARDAFIEKWPKIHTCEPTKSHNNTGKWKDLMSAKLADFKQIDGHAIITYYAWHVTREMRNPGYNNKQKRLQAHR